MSFTRETYVAAMLGGVFIFGSFFLAGLGLYSLFVGGIYWNSALPIMAMWCAVSMACMLFSISELRKLGVN
jgi:hypothetical protein